MPKTVTEIMKQFIVYMAEATGEIEAVKGFELRPRAVGTFVRECGGPATAYNENGVVVLLGRRLVSRAEELDASPMAGHVF